MVGGGLLSLIAYQNFSLIQYEINKIGKIVQYEYMNFIDKIFPDNQFGHIKFIDYCIDNDLPNTIIINNFGKFSNKYGINCSGQNLKKIIISDTNIKYFDCSNNPIHTMDLRKSNIIYLICNDIHINFSYLKIPKKIVYLDCSNSAISSVDKILNLQQYKSLKFLISANMFYLDILKLPNSLIYLDTTNSELNTLSNLPSNLIYLILKSSNLVQINLSNLIKLKYLDISSNGKLNFNPNNLPSTLKILLCSNTNCSNPYNLSLGLEQLD